jgi:nucleoside-diphosphate-sugar epimerase
MKLAITGSTGFLGSHCAAESFKKGYSVRLLVRNHQKAHRALTMHNLNPKDFEIVQADLQDADSLSDAIKGTDLLLHAAAVFSLSPLDAKTMLRVNPLSTEALLSSAAKHGLKQTVYVSTMGVFAPITGDDIDENTETSTGLGPYTKSKINSERIAREFQKDGAPVNIVYPGGIFGPIDPNPDLSDSMRMLTEILKRNIGLTASSAKLAMVDVRDVANVCVGALNTESKNARYHAWGELVTMDQVIELVKRITGRNISFYSTPLFLLDALGVFGEVFTLATRIRLPFAKESMKMFTQNARMNGPGEIDQSPANRHFGFQNISLEKSLTDALRWLHQNGHLTSKQSGKLANI